MLKDVYLCSSMQWCHAIEECIAAKRSFKLRPTTVLNSRRPHCAMDRVPILFIEEVLLQLDDECPWKTDNDASKFPSIWGRVHDIQRSKKHIYLSVYVFSDKEAVFSVSNFGTSDPLVNLEQFCLKSIRVHEGHQTMADDSSHHPLTEANFKVLWKQLAQGRVYSISLEVDEHRSHPLVNRLISAPPRFVKFEAFKLLPSSIEALTRSVEIGILRSFRCYRRLNLTHDLLPVLLKFVASEKMEKFLCNIENNGPVSYNTLLKGVVDAFLSRKRTYRFNFQVDRGTKDICERLREVGRRKKVKIEYCKRTYNHISIDRIISS
uniref:FBD domain-containing protein n=1 Tax=Steinernema glaseri TaxID=37863 RepID=A0A1I7ZAL0_9BILA